MFSSWSFLCSFFMCAISARSCFMSRTTLEDKQRNSADGKIAHTERAVTLWIVSFGKPPSFYALDKLVVILDFKVCTGARIFPCVFKNDGYSE